MDGIASLDLSKRLAFAGFKQPDVKSGQFWWYREKYSPAWRLLSVLDSNVLYISMVDQDGGLYFLSWGEIEVGAHVTDSSQIVFAPEQDFLNKISQDGKEIRDGIASIE